jgi:mono/diheme cytochrome c family protein
MEVAGFPSRAAGAVSQRDGRQFAHERGMTRRGWFIVAVALGAIGRIGMPVLASRDPQVRPPLVIHSMSGRDLYEFYCASCHGRDGKGGGPVARALKSEPPDLTRLALQNGGVFPHARIEAIVEGRTDPPLATHGTREMPVWGPIFRGLDADAAANRERIANIVEYLRSLQVRFAALPQRERPEMAIRRVSADCARVRSARVAPCA